MGGCDVNSRRRAASRRGRRQLFLFTRSKGRLRCCGLLAWRGGNDLDLLLFWLLGLAIASLLTLSHVGLLEVGSDLETKTARLDFSSRVIQAGEAMCVQIIFGFERLDEIEGAAAIRTVGLGKRSADAGTPSIGIVKYEHRHSLGPGTVKSTGLFDDDVLKLESRLERFGACHWPTRLLLGWAAVSFCHAASRRADRTDWRAGLGHAACIS